MATLPNSNITDVPPEAPEDEEFPTPDPINTFDLVGPSAANRQPGQFKTRDLTLRGRVNQLIANMNQIATGEGSSFLFLPRDGTSAMTGDLDLGTKKVTAMAAGTANSDGVRKDQVVENRLWPTPSGTPDDYVQVSAGIYQKTTGKGYQDVNAQQVQITTSVGGGQTRYDLVHIDDLGNLGVTQGVAGTPGLVPEFPDDELMIAIIKVDETGTIVVNDTDITDVRPFLSADQNARTLQSVPIDTTTPVTDEVLQYDGSKWVPSSVVTLPTNYIGGLITSNNGSDALHDIDIAKGMCRDVDDTANIALSSVLTKRIDAVWAVGSGNGGLDTGAVAADTMYGIWLIKRPDTEVVDALFSASFTAPTMPTNYTKKRLIGAIRTDASSDIVEYKQVGDYFRYIGAGFNDVADSSMDNNVFKTGTLSAPPWSLAHVYGHGRNTTTTSTSGTLMLRATGSFESGTGFDAFAYIETSGTFDHAGNIGTILVDGSRQMEYAVLETDGASSAYVLTFGFTMFTRREP